MTQNSEILVLVADERNATLSSNVGGVTRLLREIDRLPAGETGDQRRHLFACELMMTLSRIARERVCDGVVIFAEPGMMDELRQVQTSVITRLMLAHVVGKPSPGTAFPGRSAANAQAAYRGAVQ